MAEYDIPQGECIDCANHPDTNHEKVPVPRADPRTTKFVADRLESNNMDINKTQSEIGQTPGRPLESAKYRR